MLTLHLEYLNLDELAYLWVIVSDSYHYGGSNAADVITRAMLALAGETDTAEAKDKASGRIYPNGR